MARISDKCSNYTKINFESIKYLSNRNDLKALMHPSILLQKSTNLLFIYL